jgi:hypothetical protein
MPVVKVKTVVETDRGVRESFFGSGLVVGRSMVLRWLAAVPKQPCEQTERIGVELFHRDGVQEVRRA